MIKNISEIFEAALRLLYKNRKFIFLFWGTNLAFALVLSLPVYFLLSSHLIRSVINDSLGYGFDYLWFVQFKSVYRSNLEGIPYIIYGVAGIYVLIQVFFLGGIIAVLNMSKKNHHVDFFYGGVKYWYRFTKVLLVSLIFYAFAFIVNDYTGQLLHYAFAGKEKIIVEFILRASRYIFLIFLIGLVSLISDYTKIALAVKDSGSVIKEIIHTLKFLRRNFYHTFVVFFLVAVLGALGAVVYNIVSNTLPRTHYLYFILTFVLQQLLIIFRLIVRVLFTSTEIVIYKDLSAPVIPAMAEEVI